MEWHFPDSAWVGWHDVDDPGMLIKDVQASISQTLWKEADAPYDGGGMDVGVYCVTLWN